MKTADWFSEVCCGAADAAVAQANRHAAVVAAKSLGITDVPPTTWETRYIALMARASAILDQVDGLHRDGQLSGESPIDEADRLIQEAKALRAEHMS